MDNIVAIILARGGSKGIPAKNIINFCGKPLICWTIKQLQMVKEISSVWVSSDSEKILEISKEFGTEIIRRPSEISGDRAVSEEAWLHALKYIENEIGAVDIVVAPQVTSPLRDPGDIERGIRDFNIQKYDSLFSCSPAKDLCLWEKNSAGELCSVNYNYKVRKRRQDISKQYIENGSFYLFKPEILRKHNNRLGGKIGIVEMDYWKMLEIDSIEDLKICEALMKTFLLDKR